MSLFGAVRMYVTTIKDRPGLAAPDRLLPIAEGRWAAWARSGPRDETPGLGPSATSVTPDGQSAHVFLGLEAPSRTDVCEAG